MEKPTLSEIELDIIIQAMRDSQHTQAQMRIEKQYGGSDNLSYPQMVALANDAYAEFEHEQRKRDEQRTLLLAKLYSMRREAASKNEEAAIYGSIRS